MEHMIEMWAYYIKARGSHYPEHMNEYKQANSRDIADDKSNDNKLRAKHQ